MATSAYYAWDRAGRPWRVARPIKAVGDRLRAHGYTTYYLGSDDEAHLQAETPEDHAPFSATGWPGRHPYPVVNALDVMPPNPGQKSKLTGKLLPSLQQLGAQLIADRKANHPGAAWLKYINWEPEGDYEGPCWHESWQPNHRRTASGDRGHIHGSGRTDTVDSSASDDYDLVARVTGDDLEDDMDKATFKAWLHEALEEARPFDAPAVRDRLKKAGWSDVSLRGAVDYALEAATAANRNAAAAVAAVAGSSGGVDEAAIAETLAPLLLDALSPDAVADILASKPAFAGLVVAAIGVKLAGQTNGT